jgi:hypothetical protein
MSTQDRLVFRQRQQKSYIRVVVVVGACCVALVIARLISYSIPLHHDFSLSLAWNSGRVEKPSSVKGKRRSSVALRLECRRVVCIVSCLTSSSPFSSVSSSKPFFYYFDEC